MISWLGLPRKNLLTFGGDPVLDTDSGLLFHFRHSCGIGDFGKFISISHTSADNILGSTRFCCRIRISDYFSTSLPHYCGIGDFTRFASIFYSHRPIFTALGEMTDADKVINSQHLGAIRQTFGSESGLIRKIWNSNTGSLLVELDALAEVCCLRAQSSYECCVW